MFQVGGGGGAPKQTAWWPERWLTRKETHTGKNQKERLPFKKNKHGRIVSIKNRGGETVETAAGGKKVVNVGEVKTQRKVKGKKKEKGDSVEGGE